MYIGKEKKEGKDFSREERRKEGQSAYKNTLTLIHISNIHRLSPGELLIIHADLRTVRHFMHKYMGKCVHLYMHWLTHTLHYIDSFYTLTRLRTDTASIVWS